MDDGIPKLDRVFFHPTRVLIVRQLIDAAAGRQSFVELYRCCRLSNHGTLRSHLKALERADYVQSAKTFNGLVPLTTIILTESGRRAYQSHIAALAMLVRSPKKLEAHA
jgi:DNA-binding HxlR family transcriptional regulator